MEPEWTKKISSESICNFFYAFFIIYAILFVLSLVSTIGVFSYGKKMGGLGVALGFQGLVMTAVGGTMMLFYYLICDRALLTKVKEAFKAERREPY